ncbi:MAG: ABC transporter substrate-binding protein [Planctomycetota bacterium]|nr:ABC transporter substrate-binding protein [Planctomycetota bacterium]
MGRTARIREEVRWKLRAWWDAWMALPRSTRIGVAVSSLAFAAVCVALSAYLVLGARGGVTSDDVGGGGEVVLYTSTDAFLLPPILESFERQSGLTVKVVGDTEATKTTGLVERLLAERESPRADVWWSNEALGTIALAKAGVLEPFASKQEATLGAAWPAAHRATDRTWYGFALRARVIAFNETRVQAADAPTRLRDLTDARWSGRVGIARPQFGTTRTQIAALIAMHGEDPVREWLLALRDNGVRVYDGNSSVVRAIFLGEIDVGLTDTDDVHAARRQQWPVGMVFESPDKPRAKVEGLPSAGAVVIPNTVALVRGGPHPNTARRLADFLLSAEVERALAASDSRNVPIRESLAKDAGVAPIPDAAPVTSEQAGAHLAAADRLIAGVFPLP